MGFRNPATSAADVDTRVNPGGAGVRVYTDNSDALHPRGVVELSDGFFGDTPATITQHSTANQRAQNASDSGGLTVAGGTYAGTTAPSLDLAVVNNGDGTWSPVAKLTGAPLIAPPPALAQTLTVPAGWGVATPLGIYVDASGYICLNGTFSNNNAFTPAGNLVFSVPLGYAPTRNKFFTMSAHTSAVLVHCSVRTDGSFVLDAAAGSIPAGSFFDVGPIRYHPTA